MSEPFKSFDSSWPDVHALRMHTRISTSPPTPPAAPPIVLVHGLGVSSRYLAPTAERLTTGFKVFVPELPGFGQSDKPRQTFNVPELTDVLAAWLAAVGLDRAMFLGNSLGCQVIVDLAARYPQCVSRAILVGPTVDTVDRTFPRQLWRRISRLAIRALVAIANPRARLLGVRHEKDLSNMPLCG